MKDIAITALLLVASCSIILISNIAESCNEAVCASVVSKCMLTQSCKCDLKNCSCCQECFQCLSYLYNECCSCVEMCPKPNTSANGLSKKSHVEEFQDPIPELFQALMAEPDTLDRWHTFTFPVDIDIAIYRPKFEKDIKMLTQNNEQEVAPRKDIITLNCTVSYMSQCMSWNKCESSCQSTGASKYRWFHDGCCECIGHTCINFGINESRCMDCPMSKNDGQDEDKATYYYDDEIEYGIEEKNFKQAAAEAHRMS